MAGLKRFSVRPKVVYGQDSSDAGVAETNAEAKCLQWTPSSAIT